MRPARLVGELLSDVVVERQGRSRIMTIKFRHLDVNESHSRERGAPLSRADEALEASVADRFGDVLRRNLLASGKIGDRARNACEPVDGAR